MWVLLNKETLQVGEARNIRQLQGENGQQKVSRESERNQEPEINGPGKSDNQKRMVKKLAHFGLKEKNPREMMLKRRKRETLLRRCNPLFAMHAHCLFHSPLFFAAHTHKHMLTVQLVASRCCV